MADAALIRLRRAARRLARTPLHPQWLLSRAPTDISALRLTSGNTVLDIGCGGRWLEAQLPLGVGYLGLDFPASGSRYAARPDAFGDAAHLPILDGTVDAVAILEVLEHVRSPDRAIHEIARVLKPGGRLLLTMPFLYPVHDAPFDFQRYTPFRLRRDLEAAGLHVESIRPALRAYETSGLLACLAIASGFAECVDRRSPKVILAAALMALVPLINLVAWAAGRVLPGWDGLASGYHVVGAKP